jgi:hydrogenase maturation protease
MKFVVLGIGQKYRGDDAAGLEAVRVWQKKFPETAASARIELSESVGFELLALFDGMEAVFVLDAVYRSKPGGALLTFYKEQIRSIDQHPTSAHGWGIAETLKLGFLTRPALNECHIVLIGIEGVNFNIGLGMTPEVLIGVKKASEQLENEIQKYLKEKEAGSKGVSFRRFLNI